MEEVWRVLISDEPAPTSATTTGAAPSAASEHKDIPKKQKAFFEQFSDYWKKWRPFIVSGGLLYGMYKASQVVSETMKAIWQILGAFMDVFLAPLMPIFAKILEAIAPLVPRIAALADALFTPIVNFIVPLIEKVVDWLEGLDWERAEEWIADAGEKIVNWIKIAYTWLKDTAWPWLQEIWPKVVEGVINLYNWFVNDAWPWLVNAWNWLKETAWPVIESVFKGIWETLKVASQVIGFVYDTLKLIFYDIPKKIGEVMGNIIMWLVEKAVELGEFLIKIWDTLRGIWDWWVDKILSVLEFMWDTLKNTWETLSGIWETIKNTVGDTLSNIWDTLKSVWNSIIGLPSSIASAISGFLSDPFGIFKQLGGYIPKSGMYYLHRGEEVKTAAATSTVGGGGRNIIEIQNIFNIELQTSTNVDALVKEIEDKVIGSLTTVLRRTT